MIISALIEFFLGIGFTIAGLWILVLIEEGAFKKKMKAMQKSLPPNPIYHDITGDKCNQDPPGRILDSKVAEMLGVSYTTYFNPSENVELIVSHLENTSLCDVDINYLENKEWYLSFSKRIEDTYYNVELTNESLALGICRALVSFPKDLAGRL